ncbi:hypothetical protein MSG28_013660 [Choristoneura fumiferana]|uniref:Uncharacterized protein n=1 Tax=Choristoneura fumiferana TaxID=7141 RepID=A0ACC0K8A5_CHOFU|nr:hypothetical protein MSG28_013660 [Choristoneura fumiferana]
MSFDSTSSAKRLNLERASNFMRQFRDPDSRELKKLSANQFMEVWSHYDRDASVCVTDGTLATENTFELRTHRLVVRIRLKLSSFIKCGGARLRE